MTITEALLLKVKMGVALQKHNYRDCISQSKFVHNTVPLTTQALNRHHVEPALCVHFM